MALVAGVALAAGAGAAAGQSGTSGVQSSRSVDAVAGRTVIAWSAPFARYQERGGPADCGRGQRGLVLFIPIARGPNQRTSCTAEVNQAVMVSPAATTCTPPDRGLCTDFALVNDVRRVRITIDGVPVRLRPFDWVSRQGFRVRQHADSSRRTCTSSAGSPPASTRS